MLSVCFLVDFRSDLNRLHQISASELVNWDQEISLDRSNTSKFEPIEERVAKIEHGEV